MKNLQDYTFDWARLGDIKTGRENLGQDMPIALYRLMQYTLSDVLAENFSEEQSREIFREAGFVAGRAFAMQSLDLTVDFNTFIAQLQKALKDNRVGLMRVESANLEKGSFMLTIGEDLDCSGLPTTGDTVCVYDEGFIAGILYAFTGKMFKVEEIDCWATGDRTCRFAANLI